MHIKKTQLLNNDTRNYVFFGRKTFAFREMTLPTWPSFDEGYLCVFGIDVALVILSICVMQVNDEAAMPCDCIYRVLCTFVYMCVHMCVLVRMCVCLCLHECM